MEEEEGSGSVALASSSTLRSQKHLQLARYRREYLQLTRKCLQVRKMGPKILTEQESRDMFASSESSDSDSEWPYNVRAMTLVQQQQVGINLNEVLNNLVEEINSDTRRRNESDSESNSQASHSMSEYRRNLREAETDSQRQFRRGLKNAVKDTFGLDYEDSSQEEEEPPVSVSMLNDRFNEEQPPLFPVQRWISNSDLTFTSSEVEVAAPAPAPAPRQGQKRKHADTLNTPKTPEQLKPFRCNEHNLSEVLVFNNLGDFLVDEMKHEPFHKCCVLERNCQCLPCQKRHLHLLVLTTIQSEDPNFNNNLDDLLVSLKLRYFFENEFWQTNLGMSWQNFERECQRMDGFSQLSSETMKQIENFMQAEKSAPSRTYMLHKQLRTGDQLFQTMTNHLFRLLI